VLSNTYNQFSIRVRLNKCDNAGDLRALHDKFSEYARRDKAMLRTAPVFFPFAHPDKEYNGFKFVYLNTAKDLKDEAYMMKNCVASYSSKCFSGNSLIFSMRNGRSWVTIELDPHDPNYRITQKYTIENFNINNPEFLGIIDSWHSDLVAMHSENVVPHGFVVEKIPEYLKARSRIEKNNRPTRDEYENAIQRSIIEEAANMQRAALQDLNSWGISEAGVAAYEQIIKQAASEAE
jgi:hypothetical protein